MELQGSKSTTLLFRFVSGFDGDVCRGGIKGERAPSF